MVCSSGYSYCSKTSTWTKTASLFLAKNRIDIFSSIPVVVCNIIPGMFLDDINRKMRKQRGKGEYWDRFDYLDLENNKEVQPLIPDIQLLYVKNLGKGEVNLDVNRMRVKLFSGEEKYFPGISGNEMLAFSTSPGGRLFIGQSLKENTELPQNLFAFIPILFISLIISSCAGNDEGRQEFSFRTPSGQRAAKLGSTPKAPKTVPLPTTPKSPQLP